jgi:nitroreductase
VNSDLYQAILARKSVRRYDGRRLEPATLDRVREIVATVKPLMATNRFETSLRESTAGENLAESFGAYGRILNPPSYIVPWIVGDVAPLTDLGHRVEQIAVRLTALGLGVCYVGALHREDAARKRFGLPAESRIGALLVMGYPTSSIFGQGINRLLIAGVGATSRLPLADLFYLDSFDQPSTPPATLAPLLEAARRAPSAVNAQPWRFLYLSRDSLLMVFVKRSNPRYGGGAGAQYRLYDGGICMGNITLALEALGLDATWHLLAENDPDIPPHPDELQPLASLRLS